jgi:UDP-N-acetylmuramate--alanine ligase
MKLNDARRVHFVGVGGAGMSAIAKVLLERGHSISGSDLKRSRTATVLEAMGAEVHLGHHAALVEGADLVVVSSAIPEHNDEYIRARELGIDILSRGKALALLLNDLDAVVVAGTHGKTSTTSMIVTVMRSAGRDPTYLVGGGLNDVGTNARNGRDRVAVVESDESDGSFLLLTPHIAVVTNIEADHLDHWGNFEAIVEGFRRFLAAIDPGGVAVVPATDERSADLVPSHAERVTFGRGGDVWASGIDFSPRGTRFTLHTADARAEVTLGVPGRHNVDNALAAAAACTRAGIPVRAVARGLTEFRGVERRFQVRGEVNGVTIVDDYAHHPTEVRATLEAASAMDYRRVVAVFQPHRYSRTKVLHRDFGAAFARADRVVVTDVYGAGEQPIPGVSGKLVADAVCTSLPGRAVAYLPHRDELLSYLELSSQSGDAVLTLGAGDISSLGDELIHQLRSERG